VDAALASQAIAAGAFDLTIKAMIAAPDIHFVQRYGCLVLWKLADSPSISAVPREQLIPALNVVLAAVSKHTADRVTQRFGCAALAAVQVAFRRHLCSVVEAAASVVEDAAGQSEFASFQFASIKSSISGALPPLLDHE
jgi:hypothetical protein